MPSDVPEGWLAVALGDVIRLEYGRALSASAREAGDVPVYGSNGICGQHSTALVNERAIVVGRKGTAGSVTVTSGPFWPIDTTYFVVPRVEADFDWLAATLEHARLPELNEATGVPGLNRDKAYLQPILLPPLDEQRRIAEVLRSLDVAAQASNRASESLKATEQAMIDNLCFRSPKGGWDRVELGTLLEDVRYGTSAKCDADEVSGLPVLRIPNVLGGRINFDDLKFAVLPEAEQRRLALQRGDIVVVRTNGNPSYVGRSAIVRHSEGVLLYASYLIRLRINPDRAWAPFIDAALKSSELREALLRSATTSAGNYNINSESLRRLVVPLPPLDEQRRISDVLDATGVASDIDFELQSTLRDTARLVTADLLSGRVRVPA